MIFYKSTLAQKNIGIKAKSIPDLILKNFKGSYLSWVANVTKCLLELMLEYDKVWKYFEKFPSRDFVGAKYFDFMIKFWKSYPGRGGR